MSSTRQRTNIEMPAGADDLQFIGGIGPGIARRLYQEKVLTFAQLAALSAEEIAAYLNGLAGLTAERIVKQGWIEQAGALALTAGSEDNDDIDRQRYVTFTVELLLTAENSVRRTRVAHVQGNTEESWAGWDAARLVQFCQKYAEVQLQRLRDVASAAEPQDDDPTEETILEQIEELQVPLLDAKLVSTEQEIAGDIFSDGKKAALPDVDDHLPAFEDSVTTTSASGTLIVRAVGQSQTSIAATAPYSVTLSVQLADLIESMGDVEYQVELYAKRFGSANAVPAGQSCGLLVHGQTTLIQVNVANLVRGMYRLEAFVLATSKSQTSSVATFMAQCELGLVQVY